MSTGRFFRGRYEANNGDIHPIRIQPETLTLTVGGVANSLPAGAITRGNSAKVSGGSREFGLSARTVRFVWTGAVPEGYDPNGTLSLPILVEDVWEDILTGQEVSYQGGTGVVVGKSAETQR